MVGLQLLHTTRASQEDQAYVLDGCLCGSSLLCLSVSDYTIRSYDVCTAEFLSTLIGHTCAIRDVTSTSSQPNMLYSSQEDTGVMISDLRKRKPVHFLDEFCGSGAVGSTVGVAPSGHLLGIPVNADVHIVDARTWQSVHVIANMHCDEITRLRFLDNTVYCSAGEDHMINFIDSASHVKENDMLLQAISCGEVVTKMTAYSELGLLGLIGSCENAYICPFNLEERETRFPRPDDATYLVDTCVIGGQMHLVSGIRDEDGNTGPLSVMEWDTQAHTQLPLVHKELCRIAIGVDECLITGGEDNVVAFWRTADETAASIDVDGNKNTLNDVVASSDGMCEGAVVCRTIRPLRNITRHSRSVPYGCQEEEGKGKRCWNSSEVYHMEQPDSPATREPTAAKVSEKLEDSELHEEQEKDEHQEQNREVVDDCGDTTAAADAPAKEPPPSAIKGKSGRERSTEMKLRFDPDITVMETPSYVLVMHDEEGDDEAEERAVFDRLYEEASRRSERAKAESCSAASHVAEAAAKECTFRPVVSDSAKNLGRYENWEAFLQSQQERKKTSDMHFQKKKDKLLNDEIAPLFEDMPRKHSLRIIAYLEKERNYKGPIKGWRGRFREYMQRLQEQDSLDSPWKKSTASSGTLSVHTGVVCDGTVFDRLYDEALAREAAQRVVIMTQLEKEARELYHPVTNESEYWANLDGGSGNTSNCSYSNNGSCTQRLLERRSCGNTVFEELYAKGEEIRRRHERRVEEAMGSQPKFPFKPATNPQSRTIVMERAIARARGELPERRKKMPAEETSGSPGKKNNVKFNADIFCSRLQRKESERLWRLAALKREMRMEEVSECTFRPSISRSSEAIALQKGYGQIMFTPSPHSPAPMGRGTRAVGGFNAITTAVSDTVKPISISGTTVGIEGNASQWADVSPHLRRGSDVSFARRDLVTYHRRGRNGSNVSSLHRDENAGVSVDVPNTAPSVTSVTTNFIATLSSEVQGVLTEWSEAAEAALTV